ncbi:MAG: hypothetical protein HUJ56_12800 [Erysipelotrichaceae bacterium]|nr:hypothetical protein [Erysipelotrichaceae bacterium]
MIKRDVRYIHAKCLCCGEYVMQDLYDICPVCGWENDPIQNDDPDFSGGANHDSLNEHKLEFHKLREQNPEYKWME